MHYFPAFYPYFDLNYRHRTTCWKSSKLVQMQSSFEPCFVVGVGRRPAVKLRPSPCTTRIPSTLIRASQLWNVQVMTLIHCVWARRRAPTSGPHSKLLKKNDTG